MFPSVRAQRNEMTTLSHAYFYVRTTGNRAHTPSGNCATPAHAHPMRWACLRSDGSPCTLLPGSTCRWRPSHAALCDRRPWSAVADVRRYNVDTRGPFPWSSSASTGRDGERNNCRQWTWLNAAGVTASTSWHCWPSCSPLTRTVMARSRIDHMDPMSPSIPLACRWNWGIAVFSAAETAGLRVDWNDNDNGIKYWQAISQTIKCHLQHKQI